MAVGPKRIDEKIQGPDPSIEAFGHVCPHPVAASLLRHSQFPLTAFVVAAVKDIHYVVFDTRETVRMMLPDIGLQVTRVVMDHEVRSKSRMCKKPM